MSDTTAKTPRTDILAGACDMRGRPLSSDARTRLQAFLRAPTVANWDNVYSLHVTPRLTLWQAWIAVDPQAPRVGRRYEDGTMVRDWGCVPDPFTIRRAIRVAMEQEESYLHNEVLC